MSDQRGASKVVRGLGARSDKIVLSIFGIYSSQAALPLHVSLSVHLPTALGREAPPPPPPLVLAICMHVMTEL